MQVDVLSSQENGLSEGVKKKFFKRNILKNTCYIFFLAKKKKKFSVPDLAYCFSYAQPNRKDVGKLASYFVACRLASDDTEF